MKMPTFTPAYVALYPMLCEVARDKGYALAIHGSVVSDLDLVAIPWSESASDQYTLMQAIADYVQAYMCNKDGKGVPLKVPEQKPFGRLAWCIPIGNGSVIDLSVMPKYNRMASEVVPLRSGQRQTSS